MKPLNHKVQITKEGHLELTRELKELQQIKLPEAIERVSKARSLGDLSENFEYHAAKEDHATMVGRIEELADIIKRAQIIRKATNKSSINIGNQVHVTVKGSDHVFTIVGKWEANPAEKKISNESPLGKALLGKKVGEKVSVEAPAGTIIYHIKKIK